MDEGGHASGKMKGTVKAVMNEAHGISSAWMAEPRKNGYCPATAGADKALDTDETFKTFGDQISGIEAMFVQMVFMAMGHKRDERSGKGKE
jgi:hypothetical protein